MEHGISLESLKSVNAVHEAEVLSDRYKFVNTMEIVNIMDKHGWYPSKANEVKARTISREGYQKHLIRFRQEDALSVSKKDMVLPEIVVGGSHDGTTAWFITAGLFRVVCANGLIVGDIFATHKIKHVGFCEEKVSEAILAVLDNAPRIVDKVESFQGITLGQNERVAFATSALQLKYDPTEYYANPEKLLRPVRPEDNEPSLWNTFNTVQEKLMNGKLRTYQVNEGRTMYNKSRQARAVKSVSEDIRLNKALWSLTEKMAELKTG